MVLKELNTLIFADDEVSLMDVEDCANNTALDDKLDTSDLEIDTFTRLSTPQTQLTSTQLNAPQLMWTGSAQILKKKK